MTEDQHQDGYRNPIHATSVVIDGRALLLAGRSGSGKSDLALRLIDRGALLVSDDYTMLENRDGVLFAAAPPQIAGKIEIRGVGLADLACAKAAPVALMLTLDQRVDRMPAEDMATIRLEGVEIPTLPLAAFEASAPLKAEAALRLRGLEVKIQ
jgi:serine kinase of HPr protein (carbohydrate metabolism regulator)